MFTPFLDIPFSPQVQLLFSAPTDFSGYIQILKHHGIASLLVRKPADGGADFS
jgi:hypothetical protein